MNEAIKLQEGVTTSVLHATEELSPVVAVHEGVTTAVPEVVTVAQTTGQTDHKLICLEIAVGCNQGCMNEAIKLQEGVTTSVLHATEELSPVVAVHEGVTTAVPEVVTVAQTTGQTDHKLICLGLAAGCNNTVSIFLIKALHCGLKRRGVTIAENLL